MKLKLILICVIATVACVVLQTTILAHRHELRFLDTPLEQEVVQVADSNKKLYSNLMTPLIDDEGRLRIIDYGEVVDVYTYPDQTDSAFNMLVDAGVCNDEKVRADLSEYSWTYDFETAAGGHFYRMELDYYNVSVVLIEGAEGLRSVKDLYSGKKGDNMYLWIYLTPHKQE